MLLSVILCFQVCHFIKCLLRFAAPKRRQASHNDHTRLNQQPSVPPSVMAANNVELQIPDNQAKFLEEVQGSAADVQAMASSVQVTSAAELSDLVGLGGLTQSLAAMVPFVVLLQSAVCSCKFEILNFAQHHEPPFLTNHQRTHTRSRKCRFGPVPTPVIP